MCSSKANQQPSLSNSLIITISKFQIMKKTYIIPAELIVELNSGAICQSLIIGSGNSDSSSGNGTDLVKEETGSSWNSGNKSVWDEEW